MHVLLSEIKVFWEHAGYQISEPSQVPRYWLWFAEKDDSSGTRFVARTDKDDPSNNYYFFNGVFYSEGQMLRFIKLKCFW
jgi:hypothetical protein